MINTTHYQQLMLRSPSQICIMTLIFFCSAIYIPTGSSWNPVLKNCKRNAHLGDRRAYYILSRLEGKLNSKRLLVSHLHCESEFESNSFSTWICFFYSAFLYLEIVEPVHCKSIEINKTRPFLDTWCVRLLYGKKHDWL